jgi:hypothetical protein
VGEGDREALRTLLYKQAVEMANAGHWGEAAQLLREVLAIRSSAKVRYTLGQAEEQVGRLAAAYDAYAQALADGEAAGEGDVAAASGDAMHALAPRVPIVRVVITGAASAGATATIDGRAALPGEPVRVDPGTHHIAVQAPGTRPAASTIEVSERQRLDVTLRLEPEGMPLVSAPPTTPTVLAASDAVPGAGPAPASRSGTWRTVGLVAGGAGVVALGVGTYFGVDAISKNDASNRAGCIGNVCPAGSAYNTRETARSAATVSTALLVAGGLLAAGGATLWLFAPRREAATPVQTLQVVPVALVGGGGVTVGGAWQ